MARPRPLRGPEANFRNLFLKYKRSAKKRNLSFDLTAERFRELTKSNCFFCGVKPSAKYRHSRKNAQFRRAYIYNGIDRMRNNKGYVEGNVIACCWKCNCAKASLPLKDFLLHVFEIFSHVIKPGLKGEAHDDDD